MLSIENNNPDLSCSSHKISGLKNHERGTTDTVTLEQQQQDHTDLSQSGLTDYDNHHHLPTFSLRDYVFTARRKGIEKSWPFPQQYLDICLKHGVRDPLPPFEPPDSVRNLCLRNQSLVEVNSLRKDEENVILDEESLHKKFKSCERNHQSVLRFSDQTRTLLQEPKKLTSGPTGKDLCPGLHEIDEETVPTIITNPLSKKERLSVSRLAACSREVATTSSKASKEHQVPVASKKSRKVIEPTSKKCKVVEKSGVVSNPSRTEDTVSNTAIISESMASKVCPVCKTFLSTSNTTLNAHIDQCLAVGSTSSKLDVNITPSKHKIKLVKKRLMVDIYKTAIRSTLEVLDRRNGSNWAVESKTPTPDAEVCTEGKRRRLSQTYPEDIGDESAVYLDSNGRKILILSKLDEVPVPRSGEDSKGKRPLNESKEKNMGLVGKVKCVGSKDGKHLKFKPQNKKTCSLSRTELIRGTGDEKDGMNVNFEEDPMPELPKARDSSVVELKQWVCSKRTGLSTKLDGKDACRGLRYISLTRNPLVENIQSNVSNSPEEILQNPPTPKFDKEVAGSPKATVNRFNCLNEGITSYTHGCTLKLSRTSKNLVTSPRSKRVEVQSVAIAETSASLPKRKAVYPSVEPSFSKSKPYEGEKSCIWKKSRMHRSTTKTREQVKTVWSDVNGQYSRMDDSSENNRRSLDQIRGGHESNRPNKFARSEEIDMCISDVAVSQQESEKSGRKKTKVLGGLESEPKAPTVSSHVEVHFRTGFFPEKLNDMEFAAEETSFSGKDATMEHLPPNARSNCYQSCGSEAWGLSSEQTVCDGQQGLSYSRNVIDVTQRTYMAPNVDFYKVDRGNSFVENEHTECGSEQISIPGPPGFFLPSPGEDINSDVHVDSSSLTSNRLPSSQDRSVLLDRDSSGSPVSATSTISHLHTHTISDSDCAEPNPVVGSPSVLEKLVNNLSSNGNNTKPPMIRDVNPFSCSPNMVNAQRNLGMLSRKDTKKSMVAESLKFSDDQSPCCCSKKERIPWDDSITYQAPLPRQHHMGPSVSPSVGSQMNYNPKSRPELGFASYSNCSSSKFNENTHPMLDSYRDSVSLRTYRDAASKFPSHHEFSFTNSSSQSHHHTQSPSNPVLRLMGKNLMVVSKEDDSSSQLKTTAPDSNYSTQRGFPTGNMTTTDEDFSSFYHMTSNGSVIFNKCRRDEAMDRVDVNLCESSRNRSHSSHRNSQPLAENHYVNNHYVGGLTGSFLPHQSPKGVMDHTQSSNLQKNFVGRSNSHFRYNDERGTAAPQHNLNSAYVATSFNRDVIVIDDSPDNEDAKLGREFTGESRQQYSPAAMGIPNQDPNSRQGNPLYRYQSVNHFSPREASVGTYPMLWAAGAMDNPAKPQVENSNSRGSGVGLHSSLGPVFGH
ncbi:hypothetical protein C5167_049806 [Papaver somniferum]|uniref:UBZ4-type domain-containing protein n=1 Tax=Papaver somniferum TaxID=3469 RepID=A0A4Y7KPQ0_PAPSO|nr:uncharacterized protein LOC113302302 [Papaver somniferum]XP_026406996.1 uncharacterized protein LOC113302302 [Papaver somniferum]RZC74320.1 hypothetical protein C5167_049806 [Papaver somniferum]